MLKTNSTILLLLLTFQLSNAQSLEWAKQNGDFSNHPEFLSTAENTVLDKDANTYTVGNFGGIIDFDPGPGIFNFISKGLGDCYITKLNANGNFVWAKQIGEYGNNATGVHHSIAIDKNNNIYIIGTFTGTVDFDPGNDIFNLTQKSNFSDVFIVKLNTDGNFIWAKSFGSADQTWLHKMCIAVDDQQNIYAAGHLNGTGDFNPGNAVFNLTSVGEEDIFVSKLDINGNFLWAKRMGGLDDEAAISIALDKQGNVYTTGHFWKIADFNPADGFENIFAMSPKGISDVFISKLDKNGNFVWAKQLGGSGNGKMHSNALTTDANGNVLVTGYFWNTVDVDPGVNEFLISTPSNQISEAFICKITTNGDFDWATHLQGNIKPTSITTDAMGDVYTTGFFWHTADFFPGRPVFNMTSNGGADIFISKLNSKGNFVFAKKIGGPEADVGNCINLDVQGKIHIVGEFKGTVDFDIENGVFNLAGPKTFSYIAKYKQPLPEINVKQGNKNLNTNSSQHFGTVQTFTNKDLVFTIQNNGNNQLVFDGIDITGDFSQVSIPFNFINPGLSANITVRMNATNITGNKNGKLIIKNNDLDESTYTINLAGKVDSKVELPSLNNSNSNTKNEFPVNDINNEVKISIYPNPTHTSWQVNFKGSVITNYAYTLLNAQGINVANGVSSAYNFNLPAHNLPAGNYFLHININNSKKVIKLIKE
jgi:hypothetical protein